jgi:hypothetical protein
VSRKRTPKLPEVPEGCTVFIQPGWAIRQAPEDDALPVAAGSVMLPRGFYVNVTTPSGVTVALQFEIADAEVRLPQVWAHGADVPQALDELRKFGPLDIWRQLAITKMTARALAEQLQVEAPEDVESVLLGGEDVDGWPAVRLLLPSVEAIDGTARGVAKSGRRNRITDKHLDDVAAVYTAADEEGAAPTQAVADHFHISHSTAARWVGMARLRGKLAKVKRTQSRKEK